MDQDSYSILFWLVCWPFPISIFSGSCVRCFRPIFVDRLGSLPDLGA